MYTIDFIWFLPHLPFKKKDIFIINKVFIEFTFFIFKIFNQKQMIVLVFLVSFLSLFIGNKGLSCVKQLSTCSCETNLGTILDFSPLDAGRGSKIKFRAMDSSTGITRTLEYNPCSAIICNFGTTAAVCMSYSPMSEIILGLQSTARFLVVSGNSSIILR